MGNKTGAKIRARKRIFKRNQYVQPQKEILAKNPVEADREEDVILDSDEESALEVADQEHAEITSESSSSDDEDDVGFEDENVNQGSRIVHMSSLGNAMTSYCVCFSCKKGKMELKEVEMVGLVPICIMTCDSCHFSSPQFSLGAKNPAVKFYDINRRSVVAMRMIGRGLEALNKASNAPVLPRGIGFLVQMAASPSWKARDIRSP